MATEVTTLPQNIEPPVTITIHDLIRVLPATLEYPLKVWISGQLARYGRCTGNLIFYVEGDGEISSELMQYFHSLCLPLGLSGTATYNWKSSSGFALPLYNEGRLIIDKQTMKFTEIPDPVLTAPILTVEDLTNRLPNEIPFIYTLWLTGSLVARGWSANDLDIYVDPSVPNSIRSEIRKHFINLLGWRVDVGSSPMPDREPIYRYKLYEGGLCQLFR